MSQKLLGYQGTCDYIPPRDSHETKTVHELKCWPEPFEATIQGDKTFEIRKMDRPFKKGDELWLREWDPKTVRYSGRECRVLVTFIAMPGEWKLPLDTCVMSIAPCGSAINEILSLIGL